MQCILGKVTMPIITIPKPVYITVPSKNWVILSCHRGTKSRDPECCYSSQSTSSPRFYSTVMLTYVLTTLTLWKTKPCSAKHVSLKQESQGPWHFAAKSWFSFWFMMGILVINWFYLAMIFFFSIPDNLYSINITLHRYHIAGHQCLGVKTCLKCQNWQNSKGNTKLPYLNC